MLSALRQASRPAILVMRNSSRFASQSALKVEVIDEQKGIGEICLQNPPVNSLHSELLTGLADGVKTLEKDGCRAFLLSSAIPGIFSAGLNLLEMHNQERQDLLNYWARVQNMFLTLYGTRLISIACITGAAPAGGCLLSTSCDYRLMLDHPKAVIGLSESLVGLPVPDWMRINFCDVVGRRHTDLGLQMGILFPAQEALRIGLVDELASSPEELRQRALQKLEHFLKVPDVGREFSKTASTEPLISYLSGRLQKDAELFVDNISQERVQKQLGKHLVSLKNKKKN
ncbi:enoyl-CoA delta isomerase 1, mitochondrial-like [Amphibalanus amphitrite]|uniref:enoyl-CoA delta isomerase 1, mitochondrial-like n=1 Tax=Amphibalanus amphitrite TaxID=1232801 RepID=UPI001C905A42|nr:enoyl-CoA delta isomerase 1, mitochondrial-like [Amphibalanus amphitrite]XP_043197403.1 enoyl-CoA delta isomerase 1, mitochondrial-like [Amphibalanus amphitrite]XP_043197404.1 enoyl-CoA delta isomerase 1, mitochondrial-like [Amphibalanus amphitrite]XP_043197405.1 enoyl-CoA delta isomerase 1, mitochondrial-like [Amphibalanus amphitrite]